MQVNVCDRLRMRCCMCKPVKLPPFRRRQTSNAAPCNGVVRSTSGRNVACLYVRIRSHTLCTLYICTLYATPLVFISCARLTRSAHFKRAWHAFAYRMNDAARVSRDDGGDDAVARPSRPAGWLASWLAGSQTTVYFCCFFRVAILLGCRIVKHV